MAYYHAFIETYTDVFSLAAAPLDDILKLWEGLGYYSRARNLQRAAQQVVEDFNGEFPKTYQELLTLKGVGPYTAAAIASICYGEKVAVVDGNVYRVLARLYGIETPINSTAGIKQFQELAKALIAESNDPGQHNQAMMEFGALHCTPKNARCSSCVFANCCIAWNTGSINRLPVKIKAKPVRHRHFNYLIAKGPAGFWMHQRDTSEIWGGLYQFPLIETAEAITEHSVLENILTTVNANPKPLAKPVVHLLSHQKLHIVFWGVSHLPKNIAETCKMYTSEAISELALPIVLKRFVESNQLHLWPDI